MLARPNASFALRWLDAYRTFGTLDGDAWSHHSVQLPAQLWRQHPAEIRVLPHTAFFWPDWHEDTLRALFLERSDALDHAAFAFHLWGSLAQKFEKPRGEDIALIKAFANAGDRGFLHPLHRHV